MGVKAFVVVGLGYGDESKGAVVDHLAREYGAHTVMRFSGGAQAAHNVFAPDGRHHTFAQFGSGTFAGADTFLGRDVMVNPLDMFNEYYHLASVGEADAWDRLSVSKDCRVTTPVHEAANLVKEFYRRGRAHGTTGKGIGETRRAAIQGGVGLLARSLSDRDSTRKTLGMLISFYGEQVRLWENHPAVRWSTQDAKWSDRLEAARELLLGERPDLVESMVDRYAEWGDRTKLVDNVYLSTVLRNSGDGCVILEGSQGFLLDESFGFHPHTTWSDVTPVVARRELAIAGLSTEEVQVVGVTRTYSTRHGFGPFPSDTTRESPGWQHKPRRRPLWFEEPHNAPYERKMTHVHEFGTAGEFRRSPFDAVTFRYAAWITKPDVLAVTHVDAFPEGTWPVVMSYEYYGDDDVRRYLSTGADGEITGIKPGDIAHMECVTRRLFDCYPNVEEVPLTQDLAKLEIVDAIQRIANFPVAYVGDGPKSYRTLRPVAV